MSEDKELQKLNTIENTEIDADDDDIEDAEDTIGDSSDVNKFSAAYEKETVINFNNAEQNASCYTLNTHKRQMLLNLAEEYPDDVKIISKRDDMVEVTFPKKWVKIRPPRKLTEEQRVNAVERGRALAALAAEKRAAKSNEIVMISVRRCNRCGDLFDVDKNNLSSICPKCLERDAIESEYRARQDFWGDSAQSDADKYFAPRWSGSLSFIERDGEVPPDDFMEEKLDRFVAEATAKYSEKRKEENDSILAAFLEKKPTVPRTQKQNISKTNDTEQKSEKDKVQDDLLKQLFG